MSSSLRTGTVLDSYRVVAPLGAGGMGEVYQAHDSKLDRTVALKILPAEVVRDADRVRRFVQEARAASALSHPNIVTIYDIGEAVPADENGRPAEDATPLHYIAMELVEGTTLRNLFEDRSIEPRTLLAYLAQAAEGLAKAHAAGIVHRDLKPENVMVTRDGYAKVLDFGLAKLTELGQAGSALTAAPTTPPELATREGAVLGTVGYMSPEQAMGKPIDHRTDIFAFGCLLYEAAAGRKPFAGESSVDVLHAIIREKPTPVEEVNPQIPSALVRVIRRCLAKEPDRRYQSMKDLALELHDIVEEWEGLPTPTGPVSSVPSLSGTGPSARSGLGRAGWAAIVIGAVALVAVGIVLWRNGARARAVEPFQTMQITGATANGRVNAAALSPDGRYLAYTRRDPKGMSLWLRQVATGSNVQLLPPQGERVVAHPVITPDGNYVDYTLSDEMHNVSTLYRIPVLGGAPRKILTDIDTPVTYSPDGRRMAFGRNVFPDGQMVLMTSADGEKEQIVASRDPNKGSGFFFQGASLGAAWSPDGRTIAVAGWKKTDELRVNIVLIDVADHAEHSLADTAWLALTGVAWMPDGRALVVAGSPRGQQFTVQLWRVPYPDGDMSRITNDSNIYTGVSIASDGASLASVQVQQSATLWRRSLHGTAGERQLTFASREIIGGLAGAADGTLFFHYRRDNWSGIARLGPHDAEPVPLSRPDVPTNDPAVSRDGRTVVCRSLEHGSRVVLKAMDADGDNVRELPERGTTDEFALDPDGSAIIVRDGKGLWRQPLDGGPATLLVENPTVFPLGYSPEGDRLAYLTARADAGGIPLPVIAVMPATGGKPVFEVKRPPGTVDEFRWAPDGKALTFRRKDGDGFNVWRLPLDGSPPTRVTDFDSVMLGDYLLSADGAEITYTKASTTSDAVLIKHFR